MSNGQEVQVKFGADVQGLLEGLKSSQEHLETATEAMKGDLGSMIESFEHFGLAAVGIGAVGVAFEGLKEGLDWVKEAAEHINELSRAFEGLEFLTGATIHEVNEWKVAMQMSGGTVEQLQGWIGNLTRAMATNTDEYIANGIAKDKASLMSMGPIDVIKKVMEVLEEETDATKRNIMAKEMLGRGAVNEIPQIRRFLETMEDAKKVNAEYGDSITDASKKSEAAFEKAMGAMEAHMDVLKAKAQDTGNGFLLMWKGITTGFYAMVGSIASGTDDLGTAVGESVAEGKAGGAAGKAAASPEHGKTAGEGGGGAGKTKKQVDDEAAVAIARAQAKAKATIDGIEQEKKAEESLLAQSKIGYDDMIEGAKKAAAEKLAAQDKLSKAELGMAKDDPVKIQTINAQMAQNKRDYYATIAALDDKAAEHQVQVAANADRLIAELDKAIAKENADIAKASADAQIAASKRALTQKTLDLDAGVAAGRITAEEETRVRKEMVNQQSASDVSALQHRLEVLKADGLAHVAETIKIESEIHDIKAKAAISITQIEMKANAEVFNQRKSLLDGMTAQWTDGIQKMVNGTMSWSNGFRNAMLGIGDYFEKMVIKMGLDWVKGEILKSAATAAGTKARTLSEEEAAFKSVAIWAWMAIKNVATSAWQAAAGAYAAMAAVPMIGPVLAPVVAAGALAAVISLGSHIASAEGGWENVPSDQLAMIHKNEMILPAQVADSVRNMASGTGDGGAPMHVHIHAMDAASFHDYLKQSANQAALIKVLGGAMKNRRF